MAGTCDILTYDSRSETKIVAGFGIALVNVTSNWNTDEDRYRFGTFDEAPRFGEMAPFYPLQREHL